MKPRTVLNASPAGIAPTWLIAAGNPSPASGLLQLDPFISSVAKNPMEHAPTLTASYLLLDSSLRSE